MIKRRLTMFCLGAGITLLVIGLLPYLSVSAQDATEPAPTPEVTTLPADHPPVSNADGEVTGESSYCVVCHANLEATITLEDGTTLNLQVDQAMLNQSVHGVNNPQGALGCLDCHSEAIFPHVGTRPESGRAYTVQAMQMCTSCHQEQVEELADSVHAEGLANGNLRSATCVDCHGAHDIHPINEEAAVHPEVEVNTCGDCHTTILQEYEASVHGAAMLKGDPNVPTCTDCHGVHGIDRPTTAQSRNRSPQLCADCHADEDLMAQYDISTDVFDTYLQDFHGTTVALFEQQDPNVATNKPVCYDCHGVHNITPADDSKSQAAKENLLTTCQQCHPGATADFPDSWVGHFKPTREENPAFFAVEWFYRILIPTVLGGFALVVSTDIFARIRNRGKGAKHG